MKIIFSGTPHFSKQLARTFSKYDHVNTYLSLDIKTNLLKRLYCYYHILTADVLFVNYVDAYYMKSVDFALLLNKKVVLSWIGNDVMDAVPRIKKGLFNLNYIHKTIHTTNSSWLKDELKEVNIDARYLTIYMYKEKKRKISITKKFSVLCYVAKGEEKFYGIETIIKLANDFPHIDFKIAGINNYPNIPSNIKLLGWVNMDHEYENATVYIRYPKHDGEAHSVLEALSYGKTVFYNRNYPFVNYVNTYKELRNGLENTLLEYKNNTLTPNYNAIEHIKKNYTFDKVYKEYMHLFSSFNQLSKENN